MFLEYSVFNSIGTRSIIFVGISIIFSALRNTLARILTLAVSLGQGITALTIQKHHA